MKKILLIVASLLILTGCEDQKLFEAAVLEQMQKENDLKSYKIEPSYMAECVIDTMSKNMPGVIPIDPKRLMAYRNYTKMLTLPASKDPKKTLEELRNDFGSAKELAEAHTNYATSQQECYSSIISKGEIEEKKP